MVLFVALVLMQARTENIFILRTFKLFVILVMIFIFY